jgi:signal transduction histidine kinase
MTFRPRLAPQRRAATMPAVQAAATSESLSQRLFAPLNLAAYVAWAAVAIEVAARPFALPAGLLCMALFLAGFIGCVLARPANQPLMRSRGVWLGFGVMVAAFLALLWAGRAGSTPVLLIIVAVVAALNCNLGWLITIMAALNGLMLLILWFRWDLPNALQYWLVMAGFQMFAIVTVNAQRRSAEAVEQLRRVNADLLATRSLLAEGVREAERLRLSRELHDVSGHKLTALKLHLTALARDPGPDAGDNISRAAELAGGLLGDIRAVVSQLRQHDGIAIGELLATLARDWPSPEVTLSVSDGLRMANIEQADALLRTAQEGLTNAARHAQARRVWIDLAEGAEGFTLRIEDDGRGAEPLVPGTGLTGMRERLTALNGELAIDRSPRGGLRLTARLPHRPAAS